MDKYSVSKTHNPNTYEPIKLLANWCWFYLAKDKKIKNVA